MRTIPERIPTRVRVPKTISGEWPVFHDTVVLPGDYDADCNKYGAVSIRATNGKMLGLKPDEFEVLEWVDNPESTGVHVNGELPDGLAEKVAAQVRDKKARMNIGCCDHGCEFDPPKGMGTNGGCQCLKHIRPTSLRIDVTAKVRSLRKRVVELEKELRELRDYAAGHHSDQESCFWLHSLTIDIPHMINTVLGDEE